MTLEIMLALGGIVIGFTLGQVIIAYLRWKHGYTDD